MDFFKFKYKIKVWVFQLQLLNSYKNCVDCAFMFTTKHEGSN